jgi:hypothetical protein
MTEGVKEIQRYRNTVKLRLTGGKDIQSEIKTDRRDIYTVKFVLTGVTDILLN